MTTLRNCPAPSRLLLLGVVIATSPGLSGWGAEQGRGATLDDYLKLLHYQAIPCSRTLNDLKVDGRLNKRKLRFLVDTGWALTALSPASAAGLKTPAQLGVVLQDTLPWAATDASTVVMEKLVLGQGEFLNQPAQVRKLDFDFIPSIPDGILGSDFFLRNFCLIDCGEGRIYFRAANPSPAQAAALAETLRRSGFAEVPAQFAGLLTIEVRINNQPVRLGVDTGATFSVLDQSQIARLGLTTVKWDRPKTGSLIPEDASGIIVGVGKVGAHQLKITTLKTLEIGSRTWQNVHYGVADLKPWGIADTRDNSVRLQGLLGAEMLAGQGTLIDFARAKLWLRPEKPRK